MNTPKRPLFAALLASAMLLAPATGIGESGLVTQSPSSAALDFRIVIPPIMRVLENSHPRQLESLADGEISAQQRLVVVSNMKRGFCVSLRRAADLSTWEVQTAPQSGLELSPVADGYHLCGTRPGRYTVVLEHRFGTRNSTANALHWPVQTDISAI